MYLPGPFAETAVVPLLEAIGQHPFATVISTEHGVLEADHLPLLHDPEPAPYGTLLGHVARGNPLWRRAGDGEVLVVFHGPQAYVSPGWYAEKARSGAVVPTWNYIAVHAHGPLRAVDDPAWLRAFLERLTVRHEAGMAQPWSTDDAPADYLDRQLRAVVGIAIPLRGLVGKRKLGQNRAADDRAGVIQGLTATADPQALAVARQMAAEHGDEE